MAYARGLLARWGDDLHFVAVHPWFGYGHLPRRRTLTFLDETERRWDASGRLSHGATIKQAARTLIELAPLARRPAARKSVYVQASPHHLDDPKLVARILRRERARMICLVHDLIPLQHPEYARPEGDARHRIRINTVARHAHAVLTNSAATAAALDPWLKGRSPAPLVRIAHLGTRDMNMAQASPIVGAEQPYFVCVGTIEPRKNHLLLLHIWRQLAERHTLPDVPKLLVIGRRGWENEQVVDMLERCHALAGYVEERADVADQDISRLITGARALLLPSFAEGFGMPVTEALAAGVPVICSDIPALREAGSDAPDYLDPLDGPTWIRYITDFASHGPLRAAQLVRISRWQPPTWRTHIDIVSDLIERAAV